MPVQQEMEAAIAKARGRAVQRAQGHVPPAGLHRHRGQRRRRPRPARRDDRPEPAELGPGRERGPRPHGRDDQPLHRPGQPSRRAARRPRACSTPASLKHYAGDAGAGPAVDDPPRGDAQPRPGARVQGRRQEGRRRVRRPDRVDDGGAQGADRRAVPARAAARARASSPTSWRAQSYADCDRLGVRPHLAGHVHRRPASARRTRNLAAIQIGFLIDKGALTWDRERDGGERHRQGRVHDPPRQAGRRGRRDDEGRRRASRRAATRKAPRRSRKKYVDGPTRARTR